MDYIEARNIKHKLDKDVDVASKLLRAIPGISSGPMGLTPDIVKFRPDYIKAKNEYNIAANKAKLWNKLFLKTFKKEYEQERILLRKVKLLNTDDKIKI